MKMKWCFLNITIEEWQGATRNDRTMAVAATSITIKGSLDFVRASGQLEFPPNYVVIYFDTFFKCEPLHLKSPDKDPGVTKFEITGYLPEGVTQVPRDARLVFQTFVSTINDYGAICQEDTGMTSVELFETLHPVTQSAPAVGKRISKPLVMQSMASSEYSALIGEAVAQGNYKNELRIRTNQDVKGTLHIIVDSITSSTQNDHIDFDMNQNLNAVTNYQPMINMIQNYNTKAEANLKQFVINVKNTENISCVWYPSNCTFGGGTTNFMMPLPAYLMSQVPRSSPEWWMQQLDIMADRQGFANTNAFCQAWPSMTLTEKATYAMMIISQYVHALEYVSDRSNGQMIEMFGEALGMRSGDCEDFAKALVKMNQSFALYGTNGGQYRILKDLYDMSKQYVYMFCLEGVTATHTQNDTDFKSEIDGAHAAVKALPRDYFGECVARSDPSHVLGQITCDPSYKGLLPVLVGEGTGMLFPIGKIDGHEKLRRMIGDRVEAIRPIKKYLYNSPTDSKFYKQIMLGVTTEFMDNYRCATFYFTTPVQGTTPVQMGKGVPFTLLVQRSPLVHLSPLAFNSPMNVNARTANLLGLDIGRCKYSPEFTQQEMDIMKSVVRACLPPPVFIPVTNGPVIDRDLSRIRHPLMDSLCEGLKTMKPATMAFCTKNNTIGNRPEDFRWKVQYFINPQYLTQPFVTAFITQMRPLNVAVDASYLMERHLNDYAVYRLTVEMIDTCAMGIAPGNPGGLPSFNPPSVVPAAVKTSVGAPFFWH